MVFEGEELSKGVLSTDFVSLFSIFLLSKILVVRPRVIRMENKVLSPLLSYQGRGLAFYRLAPCLRLNVNTKTEKHFIVLARPSTGPRTQF